MIDLMMFLSQRIAENDFLHEQDVTGTVASNSRAIWMF